MPDSQSVTTVIAATTPNTFRKNLNSRSTSHGRMLRVWIMRKYSAKLAAASSENTPPTISTAALSYRPRLASWVEKPPSDIVAML